MVVYVQLGSIGLLHIAQGIKLSLSPIVLSGDSSPRKRLTRSQATSARDSFLKKPHVTHAQPQSYRRMDKDQDQDQDQD